MGLHVQLNERFIQVYTSIIHRWHTAMKKKKMFATNTSVKQEKVFPKVYNDAEVQRNFQLLLTLTWCLGLKRSLHERSQPER